MPDMNENAETQQEYFGKTMVVAGMEIQEDVLKLRIENEQLKEQNTYLKQSLDCANEMEKEQIEKMKELMEQIEKMNEEVKANADYQIEGRELEKKELLGIIQGKDEAIAELKEQVKVLKQQYKSLQNEKDVWLGEQNEHWQTLLEVKEQENEQLKAQIEKMRNCKNCKNYKVEGICGGFTQVGFCKNWEMQE